MYITFHELVAKYALDAAKISKVTGVSEKTAREWLAQDRDLPAPALRLLLVVYGEENPEEFRA